MPHISKENILYLVSISNEAKVYLEKLYPECFGNYDEHSPIYKAYRLYKIGDTINSLIQDGVELKFEKSPIFKFTPNREIYDRVSGYVVFYKNKWAEIK